MVLVQMDVDALKGVTDRLRSLSEQAFDEWTTVGTAASAALARVPRMTTGLTTHLPALAQLARDLEARVDLAILVNTGDDGRAPSGMVSYTLPGGVESMAAVKQALGEQLAALAGTEHAQTTPEGMAALDERLARYVDDPEVMSAFYRALPPAGLLDLMSEAADVYYGNNDISIDLRTSLLEHLKAGLHTADASWTGPESSAYAAALVGAATGEGEGAWDYENSFRAGGALSYLLYDSEFSNPFLTTVGEGIDAYERVTSDGRPGLWMSRVMGMNTWYGYFPDGVVSASWDPAVSLMSAFGNNPEVSLDFFMKDSSGGSVSERQMYWLHDRTWTDDQFSHLSEALLAATTDPTLIQPWDSASAAQAALLASHTINLIGHRPGIDGDLLTDDDGPTNAAGNFATILSTYVYGADLSVWVTGAEWNKGDVGEARLPYCDGAAPNTPLFDPDSLEKFIVLSSSTDDGFTNLRAGLDTYSARKYAIAVEALAANPEDAVEQRWFEEAYGSQAKLEGLFVHAVGESTIAEAGDADEVRKKWVELASSGIGLIPFGGVVTRAGGSALTEKLVTFTIDQARGEVASQVSEDWATLKGQAVSNQTDIAETSLDRARYDVLYAMAHNDGLLVGDLPNTTWAPKGELLTWSEYSELDGGDQLEALTYLLDPKVGVGIWFRSSEFEGAYKDAFFAYYQK